MLLRQCRLADPLPGRAPRQPGDAAQVLQVDARSRESALLDAARAGVDLVCRSGVRAERWTADEVREREPAIVGAQVGGYFYPDDAHCEPYGAVKALEAEARALGVRIVQEAEVYQISNGSGPRLLTTTRGEFPVGQIVVATGAWSESLGTMLGLRLPVIGAKGYSLVLPPADPHPKRSIYLIERKIAVNPHRDALRIAGTLELVRNDFSINARRVEVILRGQRHAQHRRRAGGAGDVAWPAAVHPGRHAGHWTCAGTR